jgi:Prion-inhibition and propagation
MDVNRQSHAPASQGTAVAHIAAVFDNFTIGLLIKPAVSKFRNRIRWAIRDGKRFKILVGEIETLVSNLHVLTKTLVPIQEHASTMLSKLEEIKDPGTLDAISEACLEDHPDLAEAASALSERRTNVTTQSQATQGIGSQSQKPIYNHMQPVEDMGMTELKHTLISAFQEIKQLRGVTDGIARHWIQQEVLWC